MGKRQKRHVAFGRPGQDTMSIPIADSGEMVVVEIQAVDAIRLTVESIVGQARKYAAEGREVEFTLGEVTFEHWGRRYRVRIDEVKR